MPSAEVQELEQWFLDRGAPNLIEGFQQRVDLQRRSRPFLLAAIVIEVVVGVADLDTAWWQNGLALAVAFAVLSAIRLARPAGRLARGELAAIVQRARAAVVSEPVAFVVLPPLLTATVGGQPLQGLEFAVANVLLLVGVYAAAGFGLVPVIRWAAGKAALQLGSAARLLARALPLLLLIQIVLFINTEMWQVADGFDGLALGVVVAMFMATGGVFLVTRLPGELDELATFTDGDAVRAFVVGTPAEGLVAEEYVDEPQELSANALTRPQRLNVSLVALFTQGMQITLVTMLVGAFFIVFGLLTITPEIMDSWLGHTGDELFSLGVLGHDLRCTAELLKISGFLAAFSGLYFTVVLVTDETYRKEFRAELLDELRQTFAVRLVYLRLLEQSVTRAPAPDPWPGP